MGISCRNVRMLRADLAAGISAKFLHSYIRTSPHIGSTSPGPHPLRLSVRAETRWGCTVGPRSCCRAWSRNVGMYESRPITLSTSPRYGHGEQEFSYVLTFLRSYADCS